MSTQALFDASYALMTQGEFLKARALLEELLSTEPNHCDARFNLGVSYQAVGAHDTALSHYTTAYNSALAQGLSGQAFLGNLLNTKMRCCDWAGLDSLQQDITRQTLGGEVVCPPFQILSFSGSLTLQATVARQYMALHASSAPLSLSCQWSPERRIRLAYVCADFRSHPVAYLSVGLLESHDKTRFEVFAINTSSAVDDPYQNRIRASVEHFVDAQAWSEEQLVSFAREQDIDIALDLTGLTNGGRAGAFAKRLAPIQMHYLGYPASSQVPNMDYIIADEVIIPSTLAHHYSERVIRMPRCFQVSDPLRPTAAQGLRRSDFGLPEDKVVLCSFCNTYKITEQMFALWMQILQQTNNTVLLLYADNAFTQNNLRTAAAEAGIDLGRLYFGERVGVDRYLARLSLCDLFLDTWPYNAGTTANDALWMDLPMLTLSGEAFISRMAASLLHALGLDELITDTPEGYVARAVELTNTPTKLQTLRRTIAQRKITSGLFDPILFARELETIFMQLVQEKSAP